MAPGVTFVTGLFGDDLGFRLYAADGTLLYQWPVNFFEIAPDEMRYRYHALIHGAHLYENGDVVANLDGRGIVRINVCGEIIWQNRDKSHHSISRSIDGSLWTPTLISRQTDYRFAQQPFRVDGVASFDAETGQKLLEINLLDILADSDGFGLVQNAKLDDVFHLNDVEFLDPSMAPAFAQFNAGDMMLSLRHLNQLWVIDGKDYTLKWSFSGPLLGQHDPDFQPDGTITVLDNRPGRSLDAKWDLPAKDVGSRILKIDPVTGRSWSIYHSDAKNTFYTPWRGKHQVMASGNILIAETDRGRAFEVTPDGTVVWSFVNGWDEKRVGWVMGATRYPPRFGEISNFQCE